MAVYPDKIVLKSSTDTDGLIKEQIHPATGVDPIIPGELVISRGYGEAKLWTIDANDQPVLITQDSEKQSAAPSVVLNFEGDGTDTPVSQLDIGVTNPNNGAARFGSYSFYSNADTDEIFKTRMLIETEHTWDIGPGKFTLEFWLKLDPANWFQYDTGVTVGYQGIISNNDYPYGPGSFNVWVDAGGTNGITGESNVAFGAVCFGLSTGVVKPAGFYPDGYGDRGLIVTSGSQGVMDNQWHHISIQHLGDGAYTIHLDGRLCGSRTYNAPINFDDHGQEEGNIPHPVGISFGGQGVGTVEGPYNQNGFNGYLDALAMYEGIALRGSTPSFVVPNEPPVPGQTVFPGPFSLGDLSDVNIPSYDDLKNNAPLVFDRNTNFWVPGADFRPTPLGAAAWVDYSINSNAIERESLTLAAPRSSLGDTLIAVISTRDADTLVAPAGWTNQGAHCDLPMDFFQAGMKQELVVYTREATASEPEDWTWTQGSVNRMAGIITSVYESAYSGVTVVEKDPGTSVDLTTLGKKSALVVGHWVYANVGLERGEITGTEGNYVQLNPLLVNNQRFAAAWGAGVDDLIISHEWPTAQTGYDLIGAISIEVTLQSALTLDLISDVEYTPAPVDGDMLIRSNGNWVPSPNILGNLTDVSIDTPGVNDILQYDGTNWSNTAAPAYDISGNILEDIGDVTLTAATAGQVLTWDGSGWVNTTITYSDISGTSPFALEDLTNVSDTAPSEKNSLVWDGTAWAPALLELGDASDVDTATTPPSDGSFLQFNGTSWVPALPVGGSAGLALSSYGTETTIADPNGQGALTELGSLAQMVEIVADANCWLTLYANPEARTLDANRIFSADPAPGSGVLAEFQLQANVPVTITPPIQLFNNSSPIAEAFYYQFRDTDGNQIGGGFTLAAYRMGIVDSISGGNFGSG